MALTTYTSRGGWLLSIIKAALTTASFNVLHVYKEGKIPQVNMPSVYLEIVTERFTSDYESPALKSGRSELIALVFYEAAENDGGAADLAKARNDTMNSIEAALATLELAEAANNDAHFNHSLQSISLDSESGQLDDQQKYGMAVVSISATWLRKAV